jgi:hypothetical protein
VKTVWFELHEHQIKGEKLFLQMLRAGKNGMYRIELFSETKRTNQQNKYMHVVFTLLQKGFRDAGYEDITSAEKAKAKVKEIFLTYETVNTRTGEVYKTTRSTSELSKDEGIEFINQVLQFAAEELGLYIPTTEEYKANPSKWGLSALAVT